ncbi:MAG TPA: FAD-dependent oxidoreductase [Acidimicrobiales bacterium]|nr:FAD-dependent oxidoreductase [Acidimicrobiales bacterium]
MADTFDVVVIGGGLAGLSVAYELVAAGARTALIDREDAGRATDAGAGILSPETTRNEDDGWFQLVLACGARYPELAAELELGGYDHGWSRCGLLMLALSDWDQEPYEWAAKLALRRRDARGTPPSDVLHEISSSEARAMFPVLGDVSRALLHRGAARVDGRRLSVAMGGAAMARGLTRVAAAASRIAPERRRIQRVETENGEVRCGAVVIAGGAWSAEWADALGVPVGVAPVRGQIVHLQLRDADTSVWPIAQPILGHYLVPWPSGRIAVGATVEPDAGFDPRPTAAGMRQLLSWTMRAAPGLADATFLEVRVGLRPGSLDGLPLLGPVPGVDNVFLATGYGADGLLLSPFCGRLVADAALGREPAIDLGPFRPGRAWPVT